jgi:hypothetical protein
MMGRAQNGPLWMVSLIVLCAGIVIVASASHALAKARERMDRTMAHARELRTLEAGFASVRDAETLLRSLAPPRIPEFDVLLDTHLPRAMPQRRLENRRVVTPEWSVLDLSLAYESVEVAKIMALIVEAEGTRPPWRLSACAVRALPGEPGRAHVEMTFSAIQHTP